VLGGIASPPPPRSGERGVLFVFGFAVGIFESVSSIGLVPFVKIDRVLVSTIAVVVDDDKDDLLRRLLDRLRSTNASTVDERCCSVTGNGTGHE
jgi:hypothetical protein